MNNQINDGWTPNFVHTETPKGTQLVFTDVGLRDYFAAAALQGILSNTEVSKAWNESDVARFCYFQADAMLRAREVKP